MKYLFIIICSLFTLAAVNAQEFITDAQMAKTAMVADNEMKVLYFTASWCGPCRMMKPGIEKMAADPQSTSTIYKMDIDTNITDDIVGIAGVPTFVFLKNGTVLGKHTGAMGDADLKALFAKHSSMKPTTDKLVYKPVPSKYEVVAGAHPKLTKSNLNKLWNSNKNLGKLAWSIHNNLDDKRDLTAGLVLVNRAIEIDQSGDMLYLKSSYLNKLGSKKEALNVAKQARKLLANKGQNTSEVDKYILSLQG